MAGTVKIKKSKNLRFRLISVLYLLFISLSILQIPIEWFRINYSLLDYMNKSTKVALTVPEIKECYDYIEDLDKRYLVALGGYDPATGKYNEPNGYSVSDIFFFQPGTGDKYSRARRNCIWSGNSNTDLPTWFGRFWAK